MTYREAMDKLKVIAAARRIGKVEVDHGETSCTTPGVVAYIEKSKAHYAKKKTRVKGRTTAART